MASKSKEFIIVESPFWHQAYFSLWQHLLLFTMYPPEWPLQDAGLQQATHLSQGNEGKAHEVSSEESGAANLHSNRETGETQHSGRNQRDTQEAQLPSEPRIPAASNGLEVPRAQGTAVHASSPNQQSKPDSVPKLPWTNFHVLANNSGEEEQQPASTIHLLAGSADEDEQQPNVPVTSARITSAATSTCEGSSKWQEETAPAAAMQDQTVQLRGCKWSPLPAVLNTSQQEPPWQKQLGQFTAQQTQELSNAAQQQQLGRPDVLHTSGFNADEGDQQPNAHVTSPIGLQHEGSTASAEEQQSLIANWSVLSKSCPDTLLFSAEHEYSGHRSSAADAAPGFFIYCRSWIIEFSPGPPTGGNGSRHLNGPPTGGNGSRSMNGPPTGGNGSRGLIRDNGGNSDSHAKSLSPKVQPAGSQHHGSHQAEIYGSEAAHEDSSGPPTGGNGSRNLNGPPTGGNGSRSMSGHKVDVPQEMIFLDVLWGDTAPTVALQDASNDYDQDDWEEFGADFQRLDPNGMGKVRIPDVCDQVTAATGYAMTEFPEIHSMICAADADSDGCLNFTEYVRVWRSPDL